MSQLQMLLRRRRRLLTRLAALLVLGLGGLLVVLPRADAHGVLKARTGSATTPVASLLSPARLSGRSFSRFYERPTVAAAGF
jgi:hypothetical protein